MKICSFISFQDVEVVFLLQLTFKASGCLSGYQIAHLGDF